MYLDLYAKNRFQLFLFGQVTYQHRTTMGLRSWQNELRKQDDCFKCKRQKYLEKQRKKADDMEEQWKRQRQKVKDLEARLVAIETTMKYLE